jgi:hypothetical protein
VAHFLKSCSSQTATGGRILEFLKIDHFILYTDGLVMNNELVLYAGPKEFNNGLVMYSGHKELNNLLFLYLRQRN